MIYIDASVLVAHLLAEDRRPPERLWSDALTSSRLLEVEAWTVLHSRGKARLGEPLRLLLSRLAVLELEEPVLARAIEPFPTPIRTLDAVHLASADYLRQIGEDISIATYDARLRMAASQMGFELHPLD